MIVVGKSLLYMCLTLDGEFFQDIGTAVDFGAYRQGHACAFQSLERGSRSSYLEDGKLFVLFRTRVCG